MDEPKAHGRCRKDGLEVEGKREDAESFPVKSEKLSERKTCQCHISEENLTGFCVGGEFFTMLAIPLHS